MKTAILFFGITTVLAMGGLLIFRYSVHPDQNDAVRYNRLLVECQQKYQTEASNGVSFTTDPCQDSIIRQQFQKKYGHAYHG